MSPATAIADPAGTRRTGVPWYFWLFGSVWYHLLGADREHARTHMTIAVPGVTTASMGLPEKCTAGGVWLMNAGTTTAHLMTQGE